MSFGLLSMGALLLLGAVLFWSMRIAEDPSEIDKEEEDAVQQQEPASSHSSRDDIDKGLEREYK